MNNEHTRRSSPLPEQPASSSNGDTENGTGAVAVTRLRSVATVERLRRRVETAAGEILRLREENKALAARMQEIQEQPFVDLEASFATLDSDPDKVRDRIDAFIEAIDHYLAQEDK